MHIDLAAIARRTWHPVAIVIGLCASAIIGAGPGHAELGISPSVLSSSVTITFDSGLGSTDSQTYSDTNFTSSHIGYGKTIDGSGSASSTADVGLTVFATAGCLCLAFDPGTGVLQNADNQTSNISTASLAIVFDISFGLGDLPISGPIYDFSGFSLGGNVGSGQGDVASFDDGFTVTHGIGELAEDPVGLNDSLCGGGNAFSTNTPGPFTAHPRCVETVISPNSYQAGEVIRINGFLTFSGNDIGADPTSIHLTEKGLLSPNTVPEPSSVVLAVTNLFIFGAFAGWTRRHRRIPAGARG